MKLIAMYLPQFHRVKENDEWWGEGYTEWTAVKDAEVYFEGQDQPRVPLNQNYYNLLDKKTMQWQADLMHQYSIYGMAIYHYWFKDGKKILEKPAENLLKWKDIDMPFCFSWANETWARSWSNIYDKNTWSTKIDRKLDIDEGKSVLIEQEYGGETEWKRHFEYLLSFFSDNRYIKVDGKPLFIIYKPMSIPCLYQMITCWRKMAQESGFKDLYILGVNSNGGGCLDAVLRQEPQNSLRATSECGIIDSQLLWDSILDEPIQKDDTVYYCGFPGYDDTPRRGEGGRVLSTMEPDIFENNLKYLIQKGMTAGNEFTFINAWNEWGEGMYLEPDETRGYRMLEAVNNALFYATKEKCNRTFGEENNKTNNQIIVERYHGFWKTLDLWMQVIEKDKTVGSYFVKHGYRDIAIYGLGMLGGHLVTQLNDSTINILYGIDRRGEDVRKPFPVYRAEAALPNVQVIVVTVLYDMEKIHALLSEKTNAKIIFITELLEELLIE